MNYNSKLLANAFNSPLFWYQFHKTDQIAVKRYYLEQLQSGSMNNEDRQFLRDCQSSLRIAEAREVKMPYTEGKVKPIIGRFVREKA